MRSRILSVALIFVIVIGLASLLFSPASAQQQQERLADEVIAAINAWRMDQNTWPLRPNATLEALANFQAQYLLTLSSVPAGVAVHVGHQQEGPRDRALWGPFDWPAYGQPARMALEEIAYAGRSLQAAIGFWQTSQIHTEAALNPAYREIGVAVLPRQSGYVFVAVLGGRPNVLPVLVNPRDKLLYLTNERYWGARGGSWLQEARQVRLLDGRGSPLGDWQPWQMVMPLPQLEGNTVFVQYSDGTVQITTAVSLVDDVARLPDLLSTPTPLPPSPTITPGPSPTPAPDVLLVYDERSIAVINISSHPVDLGSLVFANGTATLRADRWNSANLGASLYAFPPNNCVEAWILGGTGTPPRTASCPNRQGWITARSNEVFWTGESFEVRRGSTIRAVCQVLAGQCLLSLR